MKKKGDGPKARAALSGILSKRIQEGSFILLFSLSIFLFVALITYSNHDPSWSFSSEVAKIANKAGIVGAWLADICYCLFGYVAYLFPLLLFYAAINTINNPFPALGSTLWWLKIVGLVLTLTSACGLAHLNFFSLNNTLPHNSGGLLGFAVSFYLTAITGNFGATLLMLSSFLAGITLNTGLSWFGLLDIMGAQLSRFGRAMNNKLRLVSFKALLLKAPKPRDTLKKTEPQIMAVPSFKVAAVESSNALPSIELLNRETGITAPVDPERLNIIAREIEKKLEEFEVRVKVVAILPGPVITRFELDLAPGVKVSRISALDKDLARALSFSRVRVVEVIPGKSSVGIEVPNEKREVVTLGDILNSAAYQEMDSPLALALGKDIAGSPRVVNLSTMPHLLVAGTTGSGKSVAVNAMLLSLLYKASPSELRLILIDPKMLELAVYEGIPHLLTPVVTDMKDAAISLKWCVNEMERRYALMAASGVRNILGYNQKLQEESSSLEKLPYIVVIIDEFADMMMSVGKKVEELIARLAQKARAAGIHMILATQRPSVDVITGLIKANIPTRISFQVSSKIDSRTILDQMGAEQLLGHGDMLYLPAGTGIPERLHGAFVSDQEVHQVVNALKEQGAPQYIAEILENNDGIEAPENAEHDDLYDFAVQIVIESKRASISYLQRRLKIGYNRAASLIEAMETAGLVSKPGHSGNREVLHVG